MTHTYFHFDGFEVQADANDEARWADLIAGSTAPTIETSIVSYGRAAVRWNLAAALASLRIYSERLGDGTWVDDATPEEGVWMSFHLYITTLPGAGQFYYLCRTGDAGVNPRAALRINGTTGFLEVFSDGAGTWQAGTVALSTATWYVVSFKSIQSTAPIGIVRNRDTGATVDSKTHGTALGAGTIARYIEIGPYTTSTGNCVFDNWVVESHATAANIDDPVNDLGTRYACGLLLPTAAGFYNAWTGTFADVDDVPHDDSATYRSEATANDAFTQGLAPTSSLAAQVSIVKASMHFAFLIATGANTNCYIRLRSGGTDADGASTTDLPTGAYTCRQLLRTTDPATSSAWTVSGVDSAEVGVVNIDNLEARCTLLGLEVLYSVGDVTRTKVVAYVMDDFDPERRVFDARTGEELPYEEVQPNVGWLRVTSGEMPDSSAPADAWEDETLLPIDSVRLSQDASGPSLDIIPSSEGLAEQLIRGLANSSGSL